MNSKPECNYPVLWNSPLRIAVCKRLYRLKSVHGLIGWAAGNAILQQFDPVLAKDDDRVRAWASGPLRILELYIEPVDHLEFVTLRKKFNARFDFTREDPKYATPLGLGSDFLPSQWLELAKKHLLNPSLALYCLAQHLAFASEVDEHTRELLVKTLVALGRSEDAAKLTAEATGPPPPEFSIGELQPGPPLAPRGGDRKRRGRTEKRDTIQHPTLGALKYEKWTGWRGSVQVRQTQVDVVIPEDCETNLDEALTAVSDALPFLEKNESKLREALADEYLIECNTAWKDETDPDVSMDEFVRELKLIEVAARPENDQIFVDVSFESGLYPGDAALIVRLNKMHDIVDILWDE